MWVVARVKKSEINIFKNKLSEKFDKDVKFYYPKVEHHRYIRNKLRKVENFILENYIFCFHHKFAEESCIPGIKFIKGLEYFLKGHFQTQEELKKFICHCKSFEDQKGYLTSGFFKTMIEKKSKICFRAIYKHDI